MSRRANGKFVQAGVAPAAPKTFALKLQELLDVAIREKHFTGAASLGRMLNALPDAANDTTASSSVELSWIPADDMNALIDLIARKRAIFAAASERQASGEPTPVRHVGNDGRWVAGERPQQPERAAVVAVARVEPPPPPAAKPYRLPRERFAQVGLLEHADGSVTHALGIVVATQLLSGELPYSEAARAHRLQQQRDSGG